jgi:hypothetical protein
MEIYPEFLVANLNYAGGHTGHQILIWSPKTKFGRPGHHFSKQN